MKTTYTSGNDFFQRGIVNSVLMALLFLAVTLSPFAAHSHSQETEKSAEASAVAAENKRKAEDLTWQLNDSINGYQNSPAAEASVVANQLLTLAEERRQLLLEIIDIDPALALKLALPDAVHSNLPPALERLLESRMEVEGEIEVLHVDIDTPGKSHFLYFLKTALGERISLHFAQGDTDHATGTRIRAKGLLVPRFEPDSGDTDGALAIESGDGDVEVLALDGSATGSVPASGLTNTFGEQRIAVLLVNFQDNPSNKPWTTATVGSLVNGTTSDFFKENSYQQTWLKADVFGWYTMPLNSTSCVIGDISNAAIQAATNAGVNLTNYTRYVYVFPSTNACAFSGASMVGGNPSRVWINGGQSWRVYAHELGHSLGLYHSNALDCGATATGSTCTALEYGDKYDIMGTSTTAHFNAFQKERLGWLGYGVSPPLITVEAGGQYTLDGYATTGTGPKALKILRSSDLTTGKRTWYFVEYRKAFGFDSNLATATNSNVYHGTLMHSGSESTGNSSYILDMTPETSNWSDPALVADKSFSDSNAGVTITTLWENGAQASVDVNFGAATCAPANPQVAVSPSQGPWVPAGTPVAFTVTVANKDSAACANASFTLTSVVPGGWSGTYDSASLTLAPGASGSRILTVTSSLSATDGFYNITTTAAKGGYTGSASATYVVSNGAATNQPPVANSDNAKTRAGTPVMITVLANDSDPNNDPLSVLSATQGGKGSVKINSDNTVTYTPGNNFKGSDSFTYTISDGKASSSATVTVSKINR